MIVTTPPAVVAATPLPGSTEPAGTGTPFDVLVAQALEAAAPTAAPPAMPVADPSACDAATTTPVPTPSPDPGAAALPGPEVRAFPLVTPATLHRPWAGRAPDGPSPSEGEPVEVSPDPASDERDSQVPLVALVPVAPAAVVPVPVALVPAPSSPTPPPASTPAPAPTASPVSSSPVEATAPTAGHPAHHDPETVAAPVAPTDQGSAVTGTPTSTPTASTTAPAPIAATSPRAAEATPAAVRAQVFPEVTRLVSTGTGTHRVTLELNPASLGEVRVVLTVRRGVVRVSLAASPVAQSALADGAPELRRLLELGGANDSRITVRDLPSAASATPGSTDGTSTPDHGSTASGQSGSGQVRDESRRANDQHAGTRGGGRAATDGDLGQAIPPPIDPTTRTRTSGVDVTM